MNRNSLARFTLTIFLLIALVPGRAVWAGPTPGATPGPTPGHRVSPTRGGPLLPLQRPRQAGVQAVSGPYKAGEVLVKYRSAGGGRLAAAALRAPQGLARERHLPRSGVDVMRITSGESVELVIARLKQSGEVESVQPNYRYTVQSADPTTLQSWGPNLWGLHNFGQSIQGKAGVADIDLDYPEAWPYINPSKPIIVAVIDTGVDINHPDIKDRIWTNAGETPDDGIDNDDNGYIDDIHGWNFAYNSSEIFGEITDDHGTHVAGTIAAALNEQAGILGVASTPNVKLMPLKFLADNGTGVASGYTSDAIEAIHYARTMGATVINASWGGGSDGLDGQLNQAIEDFGGLFVAAAGNSGRNIDAYTFTPAGLPAANILSVAAVDNRGSLASFSNYGIKNVDVGAPGVDIYSLEPTPVAYDYAAGVQMTGSGYKAITLGFGLETLATADRAAALTRALEFFAATATGSILLINDGVRAVGGSGPDFTDIYKEALAAAGVAANRITTIQVSSGTSPGPDISVLRQYAVVIWFTGQAFGTSTECAADGSFPTLLGTDVTNLTSYLTGGGNLLLTGQDAFCGRNWNDPFLIDTLGVEWWGELGNGYSLVKGQTSTQFAGQTYAFASGDSNPENDVLEPYATGARRALIYTGALYDGSYQYMSGTSMAAPHAAGLAALALGQKNLSTAETIALLKTSGVPLGALTSKTASGRMINAYNALATQVSGLSAAPANIHPGQGSAYSIAFTLDSYGALTPGDTIQVDFPATTLVPGSIDPATVTIDGAAASAATVAGQSVTLAVPAVLAHGAQVNLAFSAGAGLVNPAAAGSYTLQVRTAADPRPAISGAYAITDADIALDSSAYHGLGAEGGEPRKALITLTAAELNANGALAESVPATVTSTADPTGIALTLTETGPDTGTFAGRFGFTRGGSDAASGLLRVADGSIITAASTSVAATATWTAAIDRVTLTGAVTLNGYPANSLQVTLSGAGATLTATNSGSGPTVDYSFADITPTGTYTLLAEAAAGSATGTATAAARGFSTAGAYDEVDTVAQNGSYYDEYRFTQSPLTLFPGSGDALPPALAGPTTPPDGAINVAPDSSIILTFDEYIQATGGGLTAISLERQEASTQIYTPVSATATLELAAPTEPKPRIVQIAPAAALDLGALYRVTIPANTLMDYSVDANLAATPVSFSFTTVKGDPATSDSLYPPCGEAVEACVSSLTVAGQAHPGFQAKVTAPSSGQLLVQVVDVTRADPLELAPAGPGSTGEVAVHMTLPAAFGAPALVRGIGAATANRWQYDPATRDLALYAAPTAAPWSSQTGCDANTCAAQADTAYNGLLALTVESLADQPALAAALAGVQLTASAQYLGALSNSAQSLSFPLGAPSLRLDSQPATGTFTLLLPESAISGLLGLNPAAVLPAAVQVRVDGSDWPGYSFDRLTDPGVSPAWFSLTVTGLPFSVHTIGVQPRGLRLEFDSATYTGLGASDAAWDGSSASVRQKVRLRLIDNGSYNTSPDAPEAVPVDLSSPDGTAQITLTETAADTGIFEGSFGFTAATSTASLLHITTAGTLTAEVGHNITTPSYKAIASAGWAPAAAQLARLGGSVTWSDPNFPTGQIQIEVRQESDGVVAAPGGLSTVIVTPGSGRLDYSAELPANAAAYRVAAHGTGIAGVSAAAALDDQIADVLTEQVGGQWTDIFIPPPGAVALVADAGADPPLLTAPANLRINGDSVVLAGTAEPLAAVSLMVGGIAMADTYASGTGAWSFAYNFPSAVDWDYLVSVRQQDLAGNAATADLSLTRDTAPPALAYTLPSRTTDVGTGVSLRFTFAEKITPVATASVVLEEYDGATATPVSASVAVTDSAGGTQGELNTLTITPNGGLLEGAVQYRVRIPIGSIGDDASPPNLLARELKVTFTTVTNSVAATGGLPACTGSATTACIAGLEINGAPAADSYKLLATTGSGSLRLQVLDTAAADPQDLGPDVTSATIRVVPAAGFTPLLAYGAAAAAAWSGPDASGTYTLAATPVSVSVSRAECLPDSCAAAADADLTGVVDLILLSATALPALPGAAAGAALLSDRQYMGQVAYDAGRAAFTFAAAGPAQRHDGGDNPASLRLTLPNTFIQEEWQRNPSTFDGRGLTIATAAGGGTLTLTGRQAIAVATGSSSLAASAGGAPPAGTVTISPVRLYLSLDQAVYHGLGGVDVAWDSVAGPVRRKAQIRLEENGMFNLDPAAADSLPALVRTSTAQISVDLTETGPDTSIFTGSFGFVEGTASDDANDLLAVATAVSISVTVNEGSSEQAAAVPAAWQPVSDRAYAVAGQVTAGSVATSAMTVRLFEIATGAVVASATGSLDFIFPMPATTASGAYQVVVGAPGFTAASGPLTFSMDPAASIILDSSGTLTDRFVADPGALVLAADNQSPAAPVLTAPAAGSAPQASLTVSGTAEPFAQMSLSATGAAVQTLFANGSGAFSASFSGLSTAANQVISATQTDAAGHTSAAATLTLAAPVIGGGGGGGGGFVLPKTAAPTIDPVLEGQTEITGTAEPGATVTINWNGTLIAEVTAQASGSYKAGVSGLTAGDTITVAAQAELKLPSDPATTEVEPPPDTKPPAAPSLRPVDSDDASVAGTAEPGATISVRANGAFLATGTAGADGAYSIPIKPQAAGTGIGVTATDAAGNISATTRTTVTAAPPPPAPGTGSTGSTPGASATTQAVSTRTDGTAALTVSVNENRLSIPGLTGGLTLDLSLRTATVGGTNRTVSLRTVDLPAAVLQSLAAAAKPVLIDAGLAKIQVPPAALALTPAGARVRLSVSESQRSLSGAVQQGFRPAGGGVVSFTAEAVSGLTGTPITEFSRKLLVTLPYSFAADFSHLGVYRFNPATGEWEYVGGKVDPVDRTVTVGLEHFSEYTVMEYSRSFDDVPPGHWAKSDIELMAARQIARGTSETEFAPAGNVTRAQFATLLARALALSPYTGQAATFADALPTDWFFSAVETAARAGLITGADGRFRPGDLITRQEIAVMLGRAVALRGRALALSDGDVALLLAPYEDGGLIAAWARTAAAQAVQIRLISGRTAVTYAPLANASRAEAVVVLKRLLLFLGEI